LNSPLLATVHPELLLVGLRVGQHVADCILVVDHQSKLAALVSKSTVEGQRAMVGDVL
jgi:hypothetical protein